MKWKQTAATLALAALATVGGTAAQQPAPAGGGPDRVAAFKQSMQEGLAKIRQYEWVETTIISLKGEEKARKQSASSTGAPRASTSTTMECTSTSMSSDCSES